MKLNTIFVYLAGGVIQHIYSHIIESPSKQGEINDPSEYEQMPLVLWNVADSSKTTRIHVAIRYLLT